MARMLMWRRMGALIGRAGAGRPAGRTAALRGLDARPTPGGRAHLPRLAPHRLARPAPAAPVARRGSGPGERTARARTGRGGNTVRGLASTHTLACNLMVR